MDAGQGDWQRWRRQHRGTDGLYFAAAGGARRGVRGPATFTSGGQGEGGNLAAVGLTLQDQVEVVGGHLPVAGPQVVAERPIGRIGGPHDDAAVVPDHVPRTRLLELGDRAVELALAQRAWEEVIG